MASSEPPAKDHSAIPALQLASGLAGQLQQLCDSRLAVMTECVAPASSLTAAHRHVNVGPRRRLSRAIGVPDDLACHIGQSDTGCSRSVLHHTGATALGQLQSDRALVLMRRSCRRRARMCRRHRCAGALARVRMLCPTLSTDVCTLACARAQLASCGRICSRCSQFEFRL